MNETLQTALKKLRLSGLAQSLDIRLQEAASHGLNHAEFLELILQDELMVRADRHMNRRLRQACFREPKMLEPIHSHYDRRHTFYEGGKSPYSMC
jgi:hypothetical protein